MLFPSQPSKNQAKKHDTGYCGDSNRFVWVSFAQARKLTASVVEKDQLEAQLPLFETGTVVAHDAHSVLALNDSGATKSPGTEKLSRIPLA